MARPPAPSIIIRDGVCCQPLRMAPQTVTEQSMLLSIIVPARDEESSIGAMLEAAVQVLDREEIPFEIVVVDDDSKDGTQSVVRNFMAEDRRIRLVHCVKLHGYGMAVRKGLETFRGDAVAVMMADLSDDPEDLVRCYRKLEEGFDCVFGSRFLPDSKLVGYPPHKLVINRLANWFIRTLFGIRLNDTTNAFKLYRRSVVELIQPLVSCQFNLTVEMPLKAIVRGCTFAVIPISWRNRATGVSKLKLREMGSSYLISTLYLWLEKHLSHSGLSSSEPAGRRLLETAPDPGSATDLPRE